MKRIKTNYHTLHLLKNAQPKMRKANISNCERDLVNCISGCVLNVLNGNIPLTGCEKRKSSKDKLVLYKFVDKQCPLPGKKQLIVERGSFLLPLLAEVLPMLGSLITTK